MVRGEGWGGGGGGGDPPTLRMPGRNTENYRTHPWRRSLLCCKDCDSNLISWKGALQAMHSLERQPSEFKHDKGAR